MNRLQATRCKAMASFFELYSMSPAFITPVHLSVSGIVHNKHVNNGLYNSLYDIMLMLILLRCLILRYTSVWIHLKLDGQSVPLQAIMTLYPAIYNLTKTINVQGLVIIRDVESITSRVRDLAPKFLWDVESHVLENKEKKIETVLICRKKFWAIVLSCTCIQDTYLRFFFKIEQVTCTMSSLAITFTIFCSC